MSTIQVVATIRQGILSGRFRRGTALPSARVLGRQLHVDKNTVSKAYGLLAREGLITVAAGRRAVVAGGARTRRPGSAEFLRDQVSRALLPIVREAGLLGITPDEVAEIASGEIRALHEAAGRRVYLLECNRFEAQQYARDLSGLLGVAVEGRLIDEIARLPLGESDVVVAPYYHFDEVAAALGGGHAVGIHVAPDPEALFQLIAAAQASEGRVALICGNPKSARRFGKLFQFYTARPVRITHVHDVKSVRALVAGARSVFATPAALPVVTRVSRAKPIPFTERIDPESLHPLRQLLSARNDRVRSPRAAAAR